MHDHRLNRRSLVQTATVTGLGLAAIAGASTKPSSLAQEVELNPGPATPTVTGPSVPPELTDFANDWPAPQGNLAGTRAAANSPIDASNVNELGVAWTWPIEASGTFGGMTAPPIVVGDTIYVQDMESNVFALDRGTGEVKWEQRYDTPTAGPNGVAIGYGRIYGSTGDTAQQFALDAETGEEIWRVNLTDNLGMGIDIAPTVYDNIVYTSTVPGESVAFYEGGQAGIFYALDAATGAPLWPWDTTAGEPTGNLWNTPWINSGGGVWYPPSVDDEGNIYFGTGNPGPWPGIVVDGTPYPNGSSRPGDNDYTNSVVSLESGTGVLRWYHNAKPHDLFDLDFQNTPVIATLTIDGQERKVAFGSGKTGTVIAYDADNGEILWNTAVGMHQNDEMTEIPEGETIRVYPGSLGGVETPIAYANGTVFVPIVNRWNEYTAVEQGEAQPLNEATGELVALDATDGSVTWQIDLPQMALGGATVANDIVFTATLDGLVRAHATESGDELFTFQANAGINAPLAIAGDLLLVPAAGPLLGGPEGIEARSELIALCLGSEGQATPADTSEPSVVQVELTEFEIRMPNELAAGATTFEVTNAGSIEHNFEVEGMGIEREFEQNLQPGESGTLEVDLQPGTYEVYCPVGDHAEQGMRLELTVTG